MRKVIIILIFCVFSLSLTSCYDAEELDELLYVIAVGVDRGISDKWRLTIQVPTMKGGGGGGQSEGGGGEGGGDGEYSNLTIDAPSFFTGIDMLNATLPRRLNFSHTKILVFSEELAKEGLLGEYIAPLSRFSQIRRGAHVFIVKDKAIDFIKENKPVIGTTISKNYEVLSKGSRDIGFYPHIPLQNFYENLKSPYGQAILTMIAVNDSKSFEEEGEPWGTEFKTGGEYLAGELPKSGQGKIEIWGTALFNGDKMVGELNGDETRLMLMVQGEFSRGLYTMPDPKKPEVIIPLDVRVSNKPKISIDTEGEKPVISLSLKIDADLLAVQSMINYEQPELRKLVEEKFKKSVEEGIDALIKKCQDLNTDAFRFGDYAARSFLTIDEFESYDWNSRFKEAEAIVNVDFTIRRTGTLIKSYPIKEPEGAE